MDELKAAFASNLIKLRTDSGMTQAELGERIHYSDKSVSKWERAESLPDALVLKTLAGIFNVSIDYLLESHDEWEKPVNKTEEKVEYSKGFIVLCAIAGIWLLCVLEFVIVWLFGYVHWIIFVAAIPLSLVTFLIFNSIWFNGRHNMYIVALLVMCIILLIYLSLLEYNFWQLFIIIAPAEIVVFLAFNIRKRVKKQ